MLSGERRISRADFPNPLLRAFEWRGEVIRVRAIRNNGQIAQFAVISPKKTYRTKITRNRFKRRVFSVLSQKLNDFDQLKFGQYLIFPNKNTSIISYNEIVTDFDNFISQQKNNVH